VSRPVRWSSKRADLWNGQDWSAQQLAGPLRRSATNLSGVSCVESFREAVGWHDSASALAEQWDGTRWDAQPTPPVSRRSDLLAVSCTSASACVAVGQSSGSLQMTLTERFDGSSWTALSTPKPGCERSPSSRR